LKQEVIVIIDLPSGELFEAYLQLPVLVGLVSFGNTFQEHLSNVERSLHRKNTKNEKELCALFVPG